MADINDFVSGILGIKDLKVTYCYLNNGIFTICAMPLICSAICPKCGNIVEKIHDVRVQEFAHLPIWGTKTVLILPIFRLECNCDPDHPFDLRY